MAKLKRRTTAEKRKASRDRIIDQIATLLEGVQVPASINKLALGTGYDAWVELRRELRLSGYHNAQEAAVALRQALGDG